MSLKGFLKGEKNPKLYQKQENIYQQMIGSPCQSSKSSLLFFEGPHTSAHFEEIFGSPICPLYFSAFSHTETVPYRHTEP